MKPDIIAVSKALSAGVIPISASVTTTEVWNRAYRHEERYSSLISTQRWNPRACAAALKAIEILVRDRLVEHATEMGEYALQRLQELKARHSIIKDVRGIGLILGIEITNERTSGLILSRMLNKHHIILCDYHHRQDVIRFEPPLNVQKEEIDRAVEALDEACGKSSTGLALGAGMTALGRKLRPPK